MTSFISTTISLFHPVSFQSSLQLDDLTGMDGREEEVAVHMAAAAAVSNRLVSLQGNFLLAIDFMMKQAEEKHDPKVQ